MFGLADLKQAVVDRLEYRAIVTHRSRFGRRAAPQYTAYLRRCRAAYGGAPSVSPEIRGAVEGFERKGFTSFWTPESQKLAQSLLAKIEEEERREAEIWDGDPRYRREVYTTFPEIEALFRGSLGSFLAATYRAHFKVFYGVLYKSQRLQDAPTGSQLWHADGGPGTCINVMFYLRNVEKADGAMECLPWDLSLRLYRKEPAVIRRWLEEMRRNGQAPARDQVRQVQCEYYRERIAREYASLVEQPTGPAGLLLPFRNIIVHKGGYPEAGRTRYACVFHCYPSHTPTPYERYRRVGIPKTASYPKDPAAEF